MKTLIDGRQFEWDDRKAEAKERDNIMNTVFYFLPKGAKPTPEQLERLKLLEKMPDEDIVFDEDCPPPTDKQVAELDYLMRKYKTRRITKEIKMKEFPERFQKRKAEAAG